MSGPRIFEDAVTGERYELLDLPRGQASWLFAPNLVCECTRCRTRFKAADISRGCPKCCTAAEPAAPHQAITVAEERVVLVPPGAAHT